ncbi:PP2C family serine/threonine-protein phosphatase [Streptomyces daliensis]
MILDRVTSPGGRHSNEDRLGNSGNFAWVIDGATDLSHDSFLPAETDVQWLVDRLGEHLTEIGTSSTSADARSLLASLSSRLGEEIREEKFPQDRIHPTCSIGLLISGPQNLQLARVGDPTCLAFGAETVELSTDFFGRREAQAVNRSKSGDLSQEENRRGIVERRQQYIEGKWEESVFSGHPKARLHIESATVEATRYQYVLLCSDGFARAVVDYGIYPDWPTLLRTSLEHGLSRVVDQIRSHEKDRPRGGKEEEQGHFKKSDDATALLVKI